MKKVNNNDHGVMNEQPILTRLENASKSYLKHLLRKLGFARSFQEIVSMHESDNNKNKIASDHLLLANEEALVTMRYFLSAYCNSNWDKHYDLLKNKRHIRTFRTCCTSSTSDVLLHVQRS